MSNSMIQNPFVVGRYVSDRYFCDRVEETAFLRKQIENGRDVAMISPRRIGKSGLIHHLFNQPAVRERYHVFFVDIYATTSLAEFVYALGKEIYERLKPKTTQWKEKFFQVISSFRVGFKLDPQSGVPVFDIGLGDIHSPETTLDEIFGYLGQADKPCIVAIDEFQQIADYAERNVEALLRTKIQQCTTTQFVFAGSKRHMMSNMFHSASKPFYQSAVSMSLEPIPKDTYAQFAADMFKDYGKRVEPDVAESVWSLYDGHTWFVQMMMNELFAMTPTEGTCHAGMIAEAQQNVVQSQSDSFRDLMAQLPPKQKMVLQAIAREVNAQSITSGKFIKKYGLNSASSVQAAVKILLKNDIVTQSNGIYRVYDRFFAQWLLTYF